MFEGFSYIFLRGVISHYFIILRNHFVIYITKITYLEPNILSIWLIVRKLNKTISFILTLRFIYDSMSSIASASPFELLRVDLYFKLFSKIKNQISRFWELYKIRGLPRDFLFALSFHLTFRSCVFRAPENIESVLFVAQKMCNLTLYRPTVSGSCCH